MRVGRPDPDPVALADARRFLHALQGYQHRPSRTEADAHLVARMFEDWAALGRRCEALEARVATLTAANRTYHARVGAAPGVWHWLKFIIGVEPCPS